MMNGYTIYIGFVVLGFVLIGIGGIMSLLEEKSFCKTITATVLECKQAENMVNGMYLTCYEIMIQFYIGGKSIQKLIKRGNKMEEGERLNILYNEAKRKFVCKRLKKRT